MAKPKKFQLGIVTKNAIFYLMKLQSMELQRNNKENENFHPGLVHTILNLRNAADESGR